MADVSSFFERSFRLIADPEAYSRENFLESSSNGMIDACIYLTTSISLIALSPNNIEMGQDDHLKRFAIFYSLTSTLLATAISGHFLNKITYNVACFKQCWALMITNGCIGSSVIIIDLYLFRIPFPFMLSFFIFPILYTGPLMIKAFTGDNYEAALVRMIFTTTLGILFVAIPFIGLKNIINEYFI